MRGRVSWEILAAVIRPSALLVLDGNRCVRIFDQTGFSSSRAKPLGRKDAAHVRPEILSEHERGRPLSRVVHEVIDLMQKAHIVLVAPVWHNARCW